jgi:hypothetical protein
MLAPRGSQLFKRPRMAKTAGGKDSLTMILTLSSCNRRLVLSCHGMPDLEIQLLPSDERIS